MRSYIMNCHDRIGSWMLKQAFPRSFHAQFSEDCAVHTNVENGECE